MHMYTLVLYVFNRNFDECLHLFRSSDRLYSVVASSYIIIKYCSRKQSRHLLVMFEYNLVFFKTVHFIRKSIFLFFNVQMCLLSSVVCFLSSCVNDDLWLLNLLLKSVSHRPIYDLGDPWAVPVLATYNHSSSLSSESLFRRGGLVK